MNKFKTILLSGGQSQRMGKHKALLMFNKSTTFIQEIIQSYEKAGFTDVIVVLNNENKDAILNSINYPNIAYVINNNINAQRLDSIKLALKSDSACDGYFIQDIDHPFINTELLKAMNQELKPFSWVSPIFNKQAGHPVLISNEIAEFINNKDVTSTTLKKVLKDFKEIQINTNNADILVNINEPSDYARYFKNINF